MNPNKLAGASRELPSPVPPLPSSMRVSSKSSPVKLVLKFRRTRLITVVLTLPALVVGVPVESKRKLLPEVPTETAAIA